MHAEGKLVSCLEERGPHITLLLVIIFISQLIIMFTLFFIEPYYSSQDVAEFLERVELSQYAQKFKENEISGDVLLDADVEMLSALDVTSSLHQMKIMHLFPRELQGTGAKYSTEHLSHFLQENKLGKYISRLKDNGIDGDMILEVDKELMENVLKEIGITFIVDIRKIRNKYKTYVHSTQ